MIPDPDHSAPRTVVLPDRHVRSNGMRLGVLHPYQLRTSGSGVYVVRVMRELLARGHQLTVLSHDDHPEQALPTPASGRPGWDRWRARSLRPAGTPSAYPRAEEGNTVLFRDLTEDELRRYLDYHVAEVVAAAPSFDVLHVNGEVPMSWVGAQVRERTGIPYVTVAHGSTLEYVARVDDRFASLARTGLARANAVVALNAEVRQRVLAVAPDAHVVTLPVGVDTEVFTPRARVPGRPPTVTFVGRLSIDKGVLHLLGAVPSLAELAPGVRVVIVGTGVDTELLTDVVEELQAGCVTAATRLIWSHVDPSERGWATDLIESWRRDPPPPGRDFTVEFRGHQDEHGVADALAEADVAMVPSLVHEAFPLVMLEALAAGVPPLATDAGGLSAVLDEIAPALGDVGPLLRLPAPGPDFARELPLRLARVLDHVRRPGAGEAVRRACRGLAEQRYSWQVVVSGLEDLYAQAHRPAHVS
ncbi:MAG: glycosyltransferase family 4 protein [Actinomycetota bacterium]|nr:glycosyltransferase family 4 protein [Actinomycetota bacterium]